jgi:glycosyltransferase involved in cell wall biosynthesis
VRKVLYFHHGGAIGGAPLSLLYLLRQLDRARYTPVVITTRPGPVVDLYQSEGIETYVASDLAGRIDDFSHTNLVWYNHKLWWPLPGRLLTFGASVRHARQIVERFQPDIVHVNSSSLAAAAIGARQAGAPVVWHIREPLARGYLGLRRAWLRRAIDRTAARVVAISEHDAAQLHPSDRVRVIHNFVDLTHFDRNLSGEGVRAELGIPPGAKVVAMLGGVSPPKGTLTFVQALPLVHAVHPNIRFLVAGPSPRTLAGGGAKGLTKRLLGVDAYQRRVLRALAQIDAEGTLTFTGVRQDIPNVLAASDVLIFPSTVAHFARPVIEAAAMAKPAIASDLGGPAELIADGETGLLVPPKDPIALAKAIIDLLDNPARAAAMGEAGCQRARKLFNAEINARATLALYDEVLSEEG